LQEYSPSNDWVTLAGPDDGDFDCNKPENGKYQYTQQWWNAATTPAKAVNLIGYGGGGSGTATVYFACSGSSDSDPCDVHVLNIAEETCVPGFLLL
jgi:hypothetical protein